MTNYRNIGKIVSTFGVKGELILLHQLGKKTSLKGLEAIFIEQSRDSMLPYFIDSARIKSESEVYLLIDGIDSKEKARPLLQKQVWLPEEEFEKFAAKSSPISFVGYHIIDDKKDLGEILEVIEQPHQVLCKIVINEKEVLIPLHEETIRKVDKKKKQVVVELPEGLLEVFLD